MNTELTGALCAIFTPYGKNGDVNVDMVEQLVEFQLDRGIQGFYVTGGTGEFLLLEEAERKLMLEAVVRFNRGRAKVVAQVGHPATAVAVRLARHAAESGADWISSVGPIYFATYFEAAREHYKAIASATDLPFMIYSFGQQVDPERDARLFDIPNVYGMKYTGTNFYSVQCLRRRVDKPIRLFAGSDEHLVAALAMGCFHGGIGTTYNIIPRHFVDICRLMKDGELHEATRLQEEANRVIELMLHGENRSYGKALMRYLGFDCGWCRAPFGAISEAEYEDYVRKIEQEPVVKRRRR